MDAGTLYGESMHETCATVPKFEHLVAITHALKYLPPPPLFLHVPSRFLENKNRGPPKHYFFPYYCSVAYI